MDLRHKLKGLCVPRTIGNVFVLTHKIKCSSVKGTKNWRETKLPPEHKEQWEVSVRAHSTNNICHMILKHDQCLPCVQARM